MEITLEILNSSASRYINNPDRSGGEGTIAQLTHDLLKASPDTRKQFKKERDAFISSSSEGFSRNNFLLTLIRWVEEWLKEE